MRYSGKRIDVIAKEYANVPAYNFVKAVNETFYSHNAFDYDFSHPDIMYDAGRAWERIFGILKEEISDVEDFSIVDVGSGTGFVSEQFLEKGPQFKLYLGFEPSRQMRDIAIRKISDRRVSFLPIDMNSQQELFSALRSVKGKKIITLNSVLHHIVWWEIFLTDLVNSMNKGDLLVLCHEPNSKFWNNKELTNFFDLIYQEKYMKSKMEVYLNPINCVLKTLKVLLSHRQKTVDIFGLINEDLRHGGVIKKDLTSSIVSAIIDYGVPLCWRNIDIPSGFDEGFFSIESLKGSFFRNMKILTSFTYQHLGFSQLVLPAKWRKKEATLEKQYPWDGAQFSLVLEVKDQAYKMSIENQ